MLYPTLSTLPKESKASDGDIFNSPSPELQRTSGISRNDLCPHPRQRTEGRIRLEVTTGVVALGPNIEIMSTSLAADMMLPQYLQDGTAFTHQAHLCVTKRLAMAQISPERTG